MTNVNGSKASVASGERKAASGKKPRARSDRLDHVAVRIAAKDVARIDALVAKHTKPWFKLTRSDMLRKLLLKALDAEEHEAGDALTDDESAM